MTASVPRMNGSSPKLPRKISSAVQSTMPRLVIVTQRGLSGAELPARSAAKTPIAGM